MALHIPPGRYKVEKAAIPLLDQALFQSKIIGLANWESKKNHTFLVENSTPRQETFAPQATVFVAALPKWLPVPTILIKKEVRKPWLTP